MHDFLTDPDAIRRAIDEKVVGTTGAWAGGEDAVEGMLKRVVADLGRAPAIIVEHAEFDCYGQGWASFVDVSLTSRDGSRRRVDDRSIEVECLPLCLCRLAAVATVQLPASRGRSHDGRSGHYYLPSRSTATTVPVAGWEQESRQAADVLQRHGIELVPPDVLARPIDPALYIETNLSEGNPPPFTV